MLSIMPLNCPWHFIPDHGLCTDTPGGADPKANQNFAGVGTEPNPFLEIMMCLHFRKLWPYGSELEYGMKLQACQISLAIKMAISPFSWKLCRWLYQIWWIFSHNFWCTQWNISSKRHFFQCYNTSHTPHALFVAWEANTMSFWYCFNRLRS